MGVDGMANEEQGGKQSGQEIGWWADLDKQMEEVNNRTKFLDATLGPNLRNVHNATGPWYAWQKPTGEWDEGDKIFWAYDFHTDDAVGFFLGNALASLIEGGIGGYLNNEVAELKARFIIKKAKEEGMMVGKLSREIADYDIKEDKEQGAKYNEKMAKKSENEAAFQKELTKAQIDARFGKPLKAYKKLLELGFGENDPYMMELMPEAMKQYEKLCEKDGAYKKGNGKKFKKMFEEFKADYKSDMEKIIEMSKGMCQADGGVQYPQPADGGGIRYAQPLDGAYVVVKKDEYEAFKKELARVGHVAETAGKITNEFGKRVDLIELSAADRTYNGPGSG
jgi:hypothetical protein